MFSHANFSQNVLNLIKYFIRCQTFKNGKKKKFKNGKEKKIQKIFLHLNKPGKLGVSAKKITDVFEAYIRHKRL
jgi:hypothetical protein